MKAYPLPPSEPRVRLELTADEVKKLKRLAGFNITIPNLVGGAPGHKEEFRRFMDDLHTALNGAGVSNR